jgi:hypothetical protein
MAHTHSQDLEARFNCLSSTFTETQQEVRELNANIATINKNMHSSIDVKMETIKQDLSTQLASFTNKICAKLNIPTNIPSSNPPLHSEGETSSNSQFFQPHRFHHDLFLLHVDVNKFYGTDPTGWVTQMEHYFSLYGITDEMAKLWYGILHLDQ